MLVVRDVPSVRAMVQCKASQLFKLDLTALIAGGGTNRGKKKGNAKVKMVDKRLKADKRGMERAMKSKKGKRRR